MTRPSLQEQSAGGVLARSSAGQWTICLVSRHRHGQATWGLPKGHVEAGEDLRTAAEREVREETGWSGETVGPLGEIRYQFTHPASGAIVSKRVTFFLMRALDETGTGPDTGEIDEARWVPLDEAMAMATYDNERQVLRKAKRHLQAGDWTAPSG